MQSNRNQIRNVIFLTVVLFVFGFVVIDSTVAGEKINWQGTSLTTETKQIEVGDEEGHVLMLTKAKQIYILPSTLSFGYSYFIITKFDNS